MEQKSSKTMKSMSITLFKIISCFAFISNGLSICAAQAECFDGEAVVIFTQSQLDSLMNEYPDCEIFAGTLVLTSDGTDPVTNVDAFSNIQSFTRQLGIVDQPVLNDLSGLSNVKEVNSFFFRDNRALENFTGLENLKEITGRCIIRHNKALVNLSGLENLRVAQQQIDIAFNENLISLSGLEGLESAGWRFYIGNNPILSSIDALESLETVEGAFHIVASPNLYEIARIDNFYSVGELLIGGNPNLTFISGMSSLVDIEKNIRIWNNPALTSLEGLSNADGEGLERFDIFNNTSLSVCHIASVCDAIQRNSSNTSIFNNAPGCNSADEVLPQCVTSAKDFFDSSTNIYPNPSKGMATIDFGGVQSGIVKVMDISGRLILQSDYDHSRYINIDLANHTGLNLIRIYHEDGTVEVLKHISTK